MAPAGTSGNVARVSGPTPDELLAWHEAAHAVIALALVGRVRLVTLEQDDDELGWMTTIEWPASLLSHREGLSARVALAGPLAEI